MCRQTAILHPIIIGSAFNKTPYTMYIALAIAEISLNLYSPLVYMEYRFVARAK